MTHKSVLLLGCLLLAGCAPRANLRLLDIDNGEDRQAAHWRLEHGAACDFKAQTVLCISAVDDGTAGLARPHRRVDLTATIGNILTRDVPGTTSTCDAPTKRIQIEYNASYGQCTHCGDPGLRGRIAFAFVRVEDRGRVVADATWSDMRGGTAEQVAYRFANDFTMYLQAARTLTCE